MGRAYEVRKASIQKTGAARGKIYTMYAKEIYLAAKNGGTEVSSNASLKRLIDRAKKDHVPSDIIKRAIDNVNRSISDIRAVVNKCHTKMGAQGSVLFNYDHVSVISFKGLDEEQTMDALIENDIDVDDIEVDEDSIVIYGKPQDLNGMKAAIISKLPNVEFDLDEITYIPKEKVELSGDDLEIFNRAITLLDDVEDVQHVYHNVIL